MKELGYEIGLEWIGLGGTQLENGCGGAEVASPARTIDDI